MIGKEEREEIIKNINIKEWKIEKILTFDGYFGKELYKEWIEMLVNKNVKLEYKEDIVIAAKGKHLVIVPNKMYRKSDFSDDEWTEIKQMLKQNKESNHNGTFSKDSSNFFSKKIAIWISVALIAVILGVIIIKKKKKVLGN